MTEIHKTFSPLFNPAVPQAYKNIAKDRLASRIDRPSTRLDGRDYLLGSQLSVADGYLFTVPGWSKHVDIETNRWPVLAAEGLVA